MFKKEETSAATVPDPAVPPPAGSAPPGPRRVTWVVGIALVLLLGWMALAPLDEGVPAAGQVVVDTRPKPVQHLTGGIVLQVLVKEGEAVKSGQPLVRLDTAATAAVHEAVRQRYYALRAAQGRLEAERDGRGQIRWHPDLKAQGAGAAQVHMQTQLTLMQSRRLALDAELSALTESARAQQALLTSSDAMLQGRQSQLGLIEEELANTRPLVQAGYAPRNRLLELQRQQAEAQTLMAELRGQRERAQRALAEIGQRRLQRQSEFQRDVQQQLSEVLRDVDADAQRLSAAEQEARRTEIVAPVAGHVLGLAVQSAGSVVQPAQKLMDIVPDGEGLLIEARVQPHLADRIRVAQPVDVRFSAFSHTPQLLLNGQVVSLSADALFDPATQASYFLARISLAPDAAAVLGDRSLVPGLPAEVVFKTGERSLLTYWLHPLVKRLAKSMKEE
jgi:protease secretion system membrane fusion protein